MEERTDDFDKRDEARVEALVEEILRRQASASLTPSATGSSSVSGGSESLTSDTTQKSGSSMPFKRARGKLFSPKNTAF